MEFKFNVNDIFKQPIVEINNNLIPPGFSGDRRALWDTLGKVSEVINAMGEASAAAQGLSKPITTADRLRNSEHTLYLLIDQAANNGKGAITGMLKVGKKGLYVFDRNGQHYQVTPPCILDFYVHESHQRTGLGKQLFEHMLQKEEIEPVKMAIDRPSEKLLGFLNKHYTLNSPIKQMNNYVVFDDFFPKSAEQTNVTETAKSDTTVGKKESANGLQKFSSPQGRYGAPRPPCSMGQIIHNQTTNSKQEPTGVKSVPATNYQGVRHGGPSSNPYPNYASQSTPNIGFGQRILNNACDQNIAVGNIPHPNYIQNNTQAACQITQNVQEVLASTNTELNRNQIPVPTANNQQYNYNQQQSFGAVMPDQNTAQNVLNVPYVANNYYTQNTQNAEYSKNNIAGNPCVLGSGNEQKIVTNPIVGNENNFQQNMQYQTSQLINPPQSGIVTHGDTTHTHPMNQRPQLNIIPQQHYPNMNQQFQSLNLNNDSASNACVTNITPTQVSADLQVHPEGQNIYREQNIASHVTTRPNDPNVTWQPSNFRNTPSQNLSFNNNLSNIQNFENANNQTYLISQHPSMARQVQVPQQEIQNMSQGTLSPNLYQKAAEPQIYPNQNIGYHNNIAQMGQVRNSNQLHSQQIQNISQQQMVPQPQQFRNYSEPHARHIAPLTSPQSVTSQLFNVDTVQASQQNIQVQQTSHSMANVATTYQQTQGLRSHAVQEQMMPHSTPCPQDASVIQVTRPAYSARNISNACNDQMSRHNIVAESSSAPNMSNLVQSNNARVTNGFEEGSRMKSKSHYNVQEQDINLNRSDVQDDDEKSLPSSKLERPRSLSIQKSEDETGDIAAHDKDCKKSESSVEPTNIESNMKTVKISDNAESENLPPSEANDVQSTKTPSHLTNQGYFDIKFYHNKLW